MLNETFQSLENGFQLFDWYHLSWLLLTAFFIGIMTNIYRRTNLKWRRIIRIGWAFSILLLESIKNFVLIGQGEFGYGSMPLHLCGLGIFIVLIHAFWKGHSQDMLLYFLTLPGALMSLLTPDWTNVSAFNYLHFHSFLFHVLLFAYPVTMLLSKELILSVRKIWQPILFLAVAVPIIYGLNMLWDTNFMFINAPVEGTPLMLIEQYFGQQYYILGLTGVVIVFWLLLLLPIVVREKFAREL